MTLSVNSASRKIAFAGAVVIAVGTYGWWSASAYIASRFVESQDPQLVRRAADMQPWNAAYRDLFGRYAMFATQDVSAAIESFQRATTLNPHVAGYWLDLAGAYELTGELDRQQVALANALAADPTTPAVNLEIGNLHLVRGEAADSLKLFRTVLAHDHENVRAALEGCWRASKDVDKLLAEVIPPDVSVHFAFIEMLMQKHEVQDTRRVWSHMLDLKQLFAPELAFPYLQWLLDQNEVELAQHAWNDLAGDVPALRHYLPGENLIVNGGFEYPILNAGFDWRKLPNPAVNVQIDFETYHSGKASLSAEFNGQATASVGLYELVPVRPNTRYVFTAYVRTEHLESDSGSRFAIHDARDQRLYAMTEQVIGSQDWTLQRAEILTGGVAKILLVRVIRYPGETPIRGKLWIDDVSLLPD